MRNSYTRVLDLLAGWGQFTDGNEPDDSVAADAICDLYQKVVAMDELSDSEVFTILVEEIYPLLCGKNA